MCGVCFANDTVQTARGEVYIEDGTTPFTIHPKTGKKVYSNLMSSGTVENLDDVTFIGWNFSRKIPHEIVFINCTNLTLIECNLVNVEMQADFTADRSLTIHKRKYEMLGKKYTEVECGDNKTRTYREDEDVHDSVEDKFKDFKKEDKDKIKAELEADGVQTVFINKIDVLISTEETPNEKKIKHSRITRGVLVTP